MGGPHIRSTCTPDGTWEPYPTCQDDPRETQDGCNPCPGPLGKARNRTAEASVEVLLEMEEPGRDLEQTLSLDLVEGSREEGTRHLHLDQGRELPKDQGILQENQEVEEVESKVEEGGSKVEVVEKPLPALEKNYRLAS